MKSFKVLFLSLLIGACAAENQNKSLSRAYGILNTDPDSAIFLLGQIDRSSFSELEKAQYALFYSIAQDKSGLDVSEDSLLRVSYDYFKEKPEDTLYAKSNYYMGLYYLQVDSSKRAVDCFYNALQASARQNDFYTQYLASNRISWEIYHQDPEEGLFYAKEACRLYNLSGQQNITNSVYLILHLEDCYRYQGERDSASVYLREALRLSRESGDMELLAETYSSMSREYKALSMPDSALYFAKLAWNVSERKEPAEFSYLANCFLQEDSLEQAETLFKHVLQNPASYYTQYNAYKGLLKITIRKKDYENLENYSDSAQSMLKKIYQSSDADNQSYRKDKQDLKEWNSELDLSLKATRYRFIIYVLISFIIIAAVCVSFYLYRIASKKRMQEEKQKAEMSLLLQEKHRLLLENKEKQLSMMKRLVISRLEYEEELDKLKNKKRIGELSNSDWLEIELFLNNSAMDFMTTFREAYPDFKESDYQLCMLLKLDLKNQELARFYGIQQESVKHKLLVLKSKLGIEDSQLSAREYIKMWLKE